MTTLNVGDQFPEGVKFTYIPVTPESSDINACGLPQQYDASKEFKNKKAVIVAVPGAFTPTCSAMHLPPYIQKLSELKSKGVDEVLFIAYNDAFVMSAWGKAHDIKDNSIIFASDGEAAFSKSIGWTMGDRTARYAIVVDHGKVIYADKESARGVDVSGVDAVLAKI